MEVSSVLEKLDNMLGNCQLDEAEKYISDTISQALNQKRNDIAITLYNEQIGFYRDCGKFEKALLSCEKVLNLIKECDLEGTSEYATTLLNVANAERAAGKYDESFETYRKLKNIYDADENTDSTLYASYYNNISLLYQQVGKWQESADSLKKALDIVSETDDKQKIAISKTNLAVSLVRLNKTDEAEKLLKDSMKYFKGLSPSDFHYSAALAAMGDVEYHKENYFSAIEYYEMARSETELHMGKNNFYDIITENIKTAKSKIKCDEKISGLELCSKYYKAFGEPVIKKNFRKYANKIVCGMVGEGSDCFGYDDEFSHDHDFGPAFCVWVDKEVYEKIGDKLQKAYDLLPKTFMGFERVKSSQSGKRVGVFESEEFYKSILGTDKIPESISEWINVDIEKLAAAVNGKIFTNTHNKFTRIRETLLKEYPEPVRMKNLAQQVALMSQYGQYNFERMMKRNDYITAEICYAGFVESVLRCDHILENRYYPYYKWLYKSTKDYDIKYYLEKAAGLPKEKWSKSIIEPLCGIILEKIKNKYNLEITDDYLDNAAFAISKKADDLILKEQLSYKIAKMEFEAFDKVQNEGGRANCQDDWYTFSIMRVSQYMTWDTDMLKQYISDFEEATSVGRNLITEKYARMMKSTVPAEYARLEDKLPPVEEDTSAMCDAICSIQVGWMEEFAKKYPKLATQTRTIHTYEDTEWNTSYETYLRGELLTYSRKMLGMYAAFIVRLAKEEKNLAKMIIENSIKLYGYSSLDEAESKIE